VHEAQVQRRVNERQLREQLERAGGRRGARRLHDLVEPGMPATRSELEDRLLELLARHGLSRPRANARVGPYEVDFLFDDIGLVLETDGDHYHGHPPGARARRVQAGHARSEGYRVLRLTWAQVTAAEEQTVLRLSRALLGRG
jgi:very-short-patch-repair endonuclease